jgi:H+/Cl- antiporter ClcA
MAPIVPRQGWHGAFAATPRPGAELGPQPNVPDLGITASYGPRFWALVTFIGVATGLAGAALIELLKLVEHRAWGYHLGSLAHAVERASPARHILVLAAAGLLAGGGMLLLRRLSHASVGETSEALWLRDGRLPLLPSLGRGVLSIVTVGMGVSLGREGAPQLAGAALGSRVSEWAGLPDWQRRLLVASGAGAGMAAVYNVPLGGALFALEVLLGTIALPLVLPALATSLIATAVAWIALPNRPTYIVPSYHLTASQMVWAAIVGPLAGFAAVLWVRAIARVGTLRPRRAAPRLLAPVAVFSALGAVSIAYPQLLGNGVEIVQSCLLGQYAVGLLAILLVLKPVATVACLGTGSPGGLFTPTLAYGVLLGALLGHGWSVLWAGADQGSYALIGGGAVLAAAMQGPIAAVVLTLELTRNTDALTVPLLLAVTGATVVARILRAPSIYSARLGAPLRAEPQDDESNSQQDGAASASVPGVPAMQRRP